MCGKKCLATGGPKSAWELAKHFLGIHLPNPWVQTELSFMHQPLKLWAQAPICNELSWQSWAVTYTVTLLWQSNRVTPVFSGHVLHTFKVVLLNEETFQDRFPCTRGTAADILPRCHGYLRTMLYSGTQLDHFHKGRDSHASQLFIKLSNRAPTVGCFARATEIISKWHATGDPRYLHFLRIIIVQTPYRNEFCILNVSLQWMSIINDEIDCHKGLREGSVLRCDNLCFQHRCAKK